MDELRSFGGKTVRESVNKFMHSLLTNNVMSLYSLNGKKGSKEKKAAFNETKFYHLLCGMYYFLAW